ncbi:MAG: DNA repair protein RadA [Chloroflexi bacterium]|nr:DNA repair protein RadA [Chloroflexota bacterium]
MAKSRTAYVCRACGASFAGWMGQCSVCRQWNTLEESIVPSTERPPRVRGGASLRTRRLGDIETQELPRLRSGIAEWDRVLGGGIVPGSVVLIGGDPGVGKSTLLIQIADAVARATMARSSRTTGKGGGAGGRGSDATRSDGQPWTDVLYVTGEESLPQVAMRARRLGLHPEGLSLGAETDVNVIIESVDRDPPGLLVVDSIQSVYDPAADSGPGSVSQLRACTLRLHQTAKERGVAVLLIGHVTKEGAIAGPKVLEHMVDAVLYLEGERLHAYRLLRGVKNRFGATNEVGVFEMRDRGLAEVANPSSVFLENRVAGGSGSAIVVTMEGSRPMLVEVQALVTRSSLSVPRRLANGIDFNRVVLLAAVLSKRGGAPLHDCDIHVNVVGGLRVDETAADLGTALAILSSHRDIPLDPETVAIGEVGLGGELRSVAQMEIRLREAAALGFRRAVVAPRAGRSVASTRGIEITQASTVREAAIRVGVQLRSA